MIASIGYAHSVVIVVRKKRQSGELPPAFQAAVNGVRRDCCKDTLLRGVRPSSQEITLGCQVVALEEYWSRGVDYASACITLQNVHGAAFCQREIALADRVFSVAGDGRSDYPFPHQCMLVAMAPLICPSCCSQMFFALGRHPDARLKVTVLSNPRLALAPTARLLFALPATS